MVIEMSRKFMALVFATCVGTGVLKIVPDVIYKSGFLLEYRRRLT